MPPAQRLLMAKPWVLIYSEWVTPDSSNSPNYHFQTARECEKKETISFAGNFNYYAKQVCDQSIPNTLAGDWIFDQDSIIGFGSKTSDTSVTSSLNIARLILVTTDSLKLFQQRRFATPDSASLLYYEMTYAH